jgi:hypothetical protein
MVLKALVGTASVAVIAFVCFYFWTVIRLDSRPRQPEVALLTTPAARCFATYDRYTDFGDKLKLAQVEKDGLLEQLKQCVLDHVVTADEFGRYGLDLIATGKGVTP